ncbi:MAG: hypothetical protein G8237_00575 [Magnetococcales bacterium]|nr:hypothetical protein [Magnetococcales bacterium]NGZ04834.1 hypothetical protein [Magnetococcales bacterium]
MGTPAFATLQARLQARHSARLDLNQWNRLSAITALEPFLTQARSTPLGLWLQGVDPHGDVHQLEVTLRDVFRKHVALIAGWSLPSWHPAIHWVATWPDLAIARHYRRFGATHPWIARMEGLELLETSPSGHDLLTWWLNRWRTLWPTPPTRHPHLEKLIQLAQACQEQADDPWSEWSRLRTSLELLFRRQAMEPGALFIHLWLTGLEIYRLRGELSRRLLFPPEPCP